MRENRRLVGTMVLDGLVEGPLPDRDDAVDTLNDWVRFTGQLGLNFRLDVDGNMFSLLADDTAFQTGRLGIDPEAKVAEALRQLAEAVGDETGNRTFSTLRSVRYEPGEEIQAVYALRADGKVDLEKHAVDAQTTAPAPPVPLKERVQAVLIVVGVIALVLAVTSLFVPYGTLWQRLMRTVTPTRVADIKIDTARFDGLLVFQPREIRGEVLWVDVSPGDSWPAQEGELEVAWREAQSDPQAHLALEALLSGYIRCEMFDADGKWVATQSVRIDLQDSGEAQSVGLALPRRTRVESMVLTY